MMSACDSAMDFLTSFSAELLASSAPESEPPATDGGLSKGLSSALRRARARMNLKTPKPNRADIKPPATRGVMGSFSTRSKTSASAASSFEAGAGGVVTPEIAGMAVSCSAGAASGVDIGVSGDDAAEIAEDEAEETGALDAGGTPELNADAVAAAADALVSLLACASLESFSKSARFLESSRAFWAWSCWISFSATWSATLEPRAPFDKVNLSGVASPVFLS